MVTATSPVSLRKSTRGPVLADSTRPNLDVVLVHAQAGDPGAFSELYVQHYERVVSICMRMVHDLSLAEDLAQETFIQLHRKLASFRGDAAFTTWLHRMTFNIVLMHLRKHVIPVISLDSKATGIRDERRGIGAPDSHQVGVVDRLALERALATLSPGRRNIFLLHDVHGFQHREIASIEGCTSGNSKSQLHMARRALRDALTTRTTCARGQRRGL
jgi:RNA polymerase sigma-70 factor (ECF subfamily)